MPDPTVPDTLTLRVVGSLAEVPAAAWDACAHGAVPAGEDGANPFVSHAFLYALETSGSATPRTGWNAAHLLLEDAAGGLRACAPAYLKTHSQGEYVFDHAWADAYRRAGGDYYPKVQVAVPFTPATGPRLLVRPGEEAARAILARGLAALADEAEASSVHVTFAPEAEARVLEAEGYLLRNDTQFHWSNEGYSTYDDFLSALASRKRKALKRERREAMASGIEIVSLTGAAIREEHLDAFHRCYLATGAVKWGRPYLTRAFFTAVAETMPERVLLVLARRGSRWVAGAINFIGADALYGRNWGCVEEHPFLHFEVCYHRAIDYAIAHGLKRVEAGAQGEHKLARGYRPVTTWSAHELRHPGLKRAVAAYLRDERAYVAEAGALLAEAAPFRKDLALDDAA